MFKIGLNSTRLENIDLQNRRNRELLLVQKLYCVRMSHSSKFKSALVIEFEFETVSHNITQWKYCNFLKQKNRGDVMYRLKQRVSVDPQPVDLL